MANLIHGSSTSQHLKSSKSLQASSSTGINSVTIVSSSGHTMAGTNNKQPPQITPIQNGSSSNSLAQSNKLSNLNPSKAMNNQNSSYLTNSSLHASSISIGTNAATGTTPNSHSAQAVKQYKNKIISCKPLCESKGTQCIPMKKDAATQIDLDEIKLSHTIVPLPVPLSVPLPMCMYQAPMPVPLILPVPIPVPVFIPTTKRTFERLERRVKVIINLVFRNFLLFSSKSKFLK